jgi:Mor family transcriptional regulator
MGEKERSFYFPLTAYEVELVDNVIFEEYRGCSLYPLFLKYMLGKQKLEGVSRAFI